MTPLNQLFLGNSFQDWLIATFIVVAVFSCLKIAQRIVVGRLAKYAKTTKTQLDDLVVDIVGATRFFFLLIVSLYFSTFVLTLSDSVTKLTLTVVALSLLLQGGLWGTRAVTFLLNREVERRKEQDAAGATTLSALGLVSKLVLWSIVLLLALDNMDVDITGLVAGLGIGGIAVALALQNILGDLFASLSIVLDKPFVIGDFIVVDDLLGTVEYVGLKTTRIRSLSGEQIVFSNSDLLRSRVRNFKRMYERRVVFHIGVTYQTPYEKLVSIGGMIKDIIDDQEGARFDRAHFKEYGSSSLNYEIVYYVQKPDFNTYMNIQQAVNLEIYRRFEQEAIEFAYPTQTLYVMPGYNGASGESLRGGADREHKN